MLVRLKSWSSCCRPPVWEVRKSDWREAGPAAEEVAWYGKAGEIEELDVLLQAASEGSDDIMLEKSSDWREDGPEAEKVAFLVWKSW